MQLQIDYMRLLIDALFILLYWLAWLLFAWHILKDTNVVGSYHNIILPDRRLADPKANWLEL